MKFSIKKVFIKDDENKWINKLYDMPLPQLGEEYIKAKHNYEEAEKQLKEIRDKVKKTKLKIEKELETYGPKLSKYRHISKKENHVIRKALRELQDIRDKHEELKKKYNLKKLEDKASEIYRDRNEYLDKLKIIESVLESRAGVVW